MKLTWHPGVHLKDIEKDIIEMAMKYFQGNKIKAAESLGISERTIYNKLKEYEVELQGKTEGAQRIEKNGSSEEATDPGTESKSDDELSAKRTLPLRKPEEVQKLPFKTTVANFAKRAVGKSETGN